MNTSRYGRLFWGGFLIGAAAMSFGATSLITHSGSAHPGSVAVWVLALAVLHDGIVAPVVLLIGVLVARLGRRPGGGATGTRSRRGLAGIQGALVATAVIALFSIPFLAGWGRQPDNPSFLPRNYWTGLLFVLAGVWSVAAIVVASTLRRRHPVADEDAPSR